MGKIKIAGISLTLPTCDIVHGLTLQVIGSSSSILDHLRCLIYIAVLSFTTRSFTSNHYIRYQKFISSVASIAV